MRTNKTNLKRVSRIWCPCTSSYVIYVFVNQFLRFLWFCIGSNLHQYLSLVTLWLSYNGKRPLSLRRNILLVVLLIWQFSVERSTIYLYWWSVDWDIQNFLYHWVFWRTTCLRNTFITVLPLLTLMPTMSRKKPQILF
jgi:hypothetical protein